MWRVLFYEKWGGIISLILGYCKLSRTSLLLLKPSINLTETYKIFKPWRCCKSLLPQFHMFIHAENMCLIFRRFRECFQIEIMMGIVFIGFKLNKAHMMSADV